MNVLSLVGVGVLLSVCFYLLSSLGARSVPLYLALGVTLLLGMASEPLLAAVSALFSLPEGGVSTETVQTVSKALSLGYLVGMSADLCDSLGASALSKAMIFGGRMLIFSLSIPYLTSLFSLAREWLTL